MSRARLDKVLANYRTALERADLSDDARRAYASRMSGFLDWLADTASLTAIRSPTRTPATSRCATTARTSRP